MQRSRNNILPQHQIYFYRAVTSCTLRFAEATRAGFPIAFYLPQSPAAQQYRELAKEVLRDAQEKG